VILPILLVAACLAVLVLEVLLVSFGTLAIVAVTLGATGVAETDLRPAGRARIDGRHLDVVAEGFVPPGGAVRVVSVRGNVITVRPEK